MRIQIVFEFTFQYVSINTPELQQIFDRYQYLHSNMFLLILGIRSHLINCGNNLHSNMFLLIQLI